MTTVPLSTELSRDRSRFGLSLPVLLGLLVYAKVILGGAVVISDGDPYWHIAAGRWIIAHHAVPRHDVFSFSMPGAPWTSPEWLAEVLIAWLYDHFGWGGLVVATALSVAVSVGMLLRVLLRRLPPVYATTAAVLAWGTALTVLTARPHIFALPVLVLWTAELVEARSEDRAPSLWLVPLMTLWVSLHPSFAFGMVLAAIFAGEAVLVAPDWRSRLLAARGWGCFGALSTAAALISPYGVEGLLLPFKLAQPGYSLAVIGEWQSPNFQQFQPLELWFMVLLCAGFSLGWRLPPIRLGILLLLLHMALEHGRYAELAGFISPLVLAPALAPQLKAHSRDRARTWIDRGMNELARPATASGLTIAAVFLFAVSAAGLRGAAVHPDVAAPKKALAAVEADHVQGPVFNNYGFGGYLMFRGIKPFIDGRYFYGDAFIRRYVEATQASSATLPLLLSQYHISWTLLPPRSPAVTLLDHLPGWRQLYADDIAVVHVRDDQAAP